MELTAEPEFLDSDSQTDPKSSSWHYDIFKEYEDTPRSPIASLQQPKIIAQQGCPCKIASDCDALQSAEEEEFRC